MCDYIEANGGKGHGKGMGRAWEGHGKGILKEECVKMENIRKSDKNRVGYMRKCR